MDLGGGTQQGKRQKNRLPPPPRLLSSRSGSATDDEWKRPVPKHPESKFFIKKRASFIRSRMSCIIFSEVDGRDRTRERQWVLSSKCIHLLVCFMLMNLIQDKLIIYAIVSCWRQSQKLMSAKFPHSPILHYAFSSWIEKTIHFHWENRFVLQ